MAEVIVPKLNSNDESYVLLEWLVAAGARVQAGAAVATIETSKATSDLECDRTGFLVPLVAAGTTCRPGTVVATVSGDPAPPAEPPAPVEGPADVQVVATRAARELIERHGVSQDAVASLGKRLVKAEDVRTLIGGPLSDNSPDGSPDPVPDASPPPGARTEALSAHQREVARTVSQSHGTIPSAFTVAKVSAGEMIKARRTIAERARAFVDLPEMLIHVAARLWREHPRCFSAVHADLTVEAPTEADIGVTVDVGTGLYVPVVRAADTLDCAGIARRLLELRVRALRRTIRESDLGAARLTVSLQTAPGIVLARPIVFPGQTCTLSMCAVQEELVLGQDGAVRPHEYFHLGLAYDHRVVNGRDAMDFLGAIRGELEKGRVE